MKSLGGISPMKKQRAGDPAPKNSGAHEVDEYLAAVSEPARSTLEKIRRTIRSVVPEGTTERLSYGMPAFHYKRPLVGYAAFAHHCSLFPMSGAVIEAMASDLQGYEVSKGTIRFAVDKPLPAALIKKIIQRRLEEIEKKPRSTVSR
jgi:uncharacterized protein YdhG (YjbR/CyaY superfamily)